MRARAYDALTGGLCLPCRIVFLVATVFLLAGCAVGRSWDTHTYYKESGETTYPNLTGLTLYIDGDASVVEKALSRVPRQEIGTIRIATEREIIGNMYPLIKIRLDPSEPSLGGIFGLTYLLSGISFSIVPGYYYVSSAADFQLVLPDKTGALKTTDFNYARKRHTFTWLPLMFGFNYVQTVQAYTEPAPTWSQLREELVRQFFRDAKPFFEDYRTSLGAQEARTQAQPGVSSHFLQGSTITSTSPGPIRILSEKIAISPDMQSEGSVHASYLLENLSDREILFRMGFPLQGRPHDSVKAVIVSNGEAAVSAKTELSGRRDALDILFWDIAFAAREQKEVRLEYGSEWGEGWPYDPVVREYRYLVKSDGYPNSTIQYAHFSITLPDKVRSLLRGLGRYALIVQPENYLLKENIIEWHFTDWRPDEDIRIQIIEKEPSNEAVLDELGRFYRSNVYTGSTVQYKVENFYELMLNGQPIYLKFDKQNRLHVRALRNEILARHGKIFSETTMKQIFEFASWYVPRPEFNERELNEMEIKNLQFIDEYAKSKGWSMTD